MGCLLRIIALGLLLVPVCLHGQTGALSGTAVQSLTQDDPVIESRKTNYLMGRFNVGESLITDLRDKGKDWFEISRLLVFSQRSGKDVDSLLVRRNKGLSWDEIAGEDGLKAADVNKDVEDVQKELERIEQQYRMFTPDPYPQKQLPDRFERGL